MYNWCIKLFFYSHHMPKYVFLTLKMFFKSSITIPVTLSMLRHCACFDIVLTLRGTTRDTVDDPSNIRFGKITLLLPSPVNECTYRWPLYTNIVQSLDFPDMI